LFWDDCWVGNRPLRDEFSKIYANCMQKGSKIRRSRGVARSGGELEIRVAKDMV